ncbi:glycosyltransferase [Bacteroides pyogenes]|uniref:glycosyltransferase n=1 Tax=Bacteroides pyogenes TaxID=310300 RepID=UPI001BA5865A|nr:glycosyltransferase [Bacteroides pyogenes]MBR8704738.1 D-inositol-3-phosphate glycosyltransferase [Bacteroides pyogenes]
MNVIYIQDQEIYCYNGHFYHSKSEHFFSRFLAGLNETDTLTVYTGILTRSSMMEVSKYKDVTNPRIIYKKIPEFRRLKNVLTIKKMMEHIVKDADFCYLRCGIAASFASSVCIKKHIPYMAVVNEDIFRNTITHSKLLVRLSAYPLSYYTHRMIREANYACYVTQEYLQNEYPCESKILGCSDIEFLDINAKSLNKRIDKIQNQKSTIVLGSVGSVSTELKGQDTVIRALAKLKAEGMSNYQFNMVGTGNPERLKNLAQKLQVADQINFLGEFKHDEVLTWFEDIDIYIHPSHSEGLPRTILEAMTKAAPCICSSVGGIPELINRDSLFTYDGTEVETLVNIIKSFTKEKKEKEAKENFERSKNYEPKILEHKRNAFFTQAINEFRKQ